MNKRLALFLILVVTLPFMGWSILPNLRTVHTAVKHTTPERKLVTDYGIVPADRFLLTATVRPNEVLGDILGRFDVDYPTILQLGQASDSLFDIRRIRTGNRYGVLLDLSHKRPRVEQFIYERDKIHYTVCHLHDSVCLEHRAKPVETVRRETAAVIESSLFQSIADAGLNWEIAIELENVYQWAVNFYRIQPGDFFKVIYDERMLGDESVGIGRVHAALFHYGGKDIYGFYHEEPDSIHLCGYYDEEGEALRRTFLQSPVRYTRISSRFTYSRYHPVQKRWKAHLGTDFAAPAGTPIYATADGVITEARYGRYNGNYVKVQHNSVYTTQYLHMQNIAQNISPGVYVQQGDVIGYVGSTGLATGPHVCYRFWKNGEQVDPFQQDLPKSEPLPPAYRERFLHDIVPIRERLDAIEPMIEPNRLDENV